MMSRSRVCTQITALSSSHRTQEPSNTCALIVPVHRIPVLTHIQPEREREREREREPEREADRETDDIKKFSYYLFM
jgi:hypothetical protein